MRGPGRPSTAPLGPSAVSRAQSKVQSAALSSASLYIPAVCLPRRRVQAWSLEGRGLDQGLTVCSGERGGGGLERQRLVASRQSAQGPCS